MDTKKLLEILDRNINQEALAKDLAIELVMPMIEKFVKDTSNPYDDKLVEMLKAFIEKQ
jgi:hypothetical protein